MKILGVIPARYGSTRFPAKALADIAGKSMIQRVYEQASKATSLTKVIVATDHGDIQQHVADFGGNVCMTGDHHRSGTERCGEVLQKEGESYDYVINIQGDEPFISPDQINLLASLSAHKVELGTLIKHIDNQEDLFNPNVVKAITKKSGEAIYFSRHPIPYQRDNQENWIAKHRYFKHIGIYAYRSDILPTICQLDSSSLEMAESLEQLRWIENGFGIHTLETKLESLGIDTPEDLKRAIAYIQS
ncbi:MAG: 3-deoxy-manno-octulosonate cytidylyltransferase [Bacteroidota bacterium]